MLILGEIILKDFIVVIEGVVLKAFETGIFFYISRFLLESLGIKVVKFISPANILTLLI